MSRVIENMLYVYMHLDVLYVIGSSQLYVGYIIHVVICVLFDLELHWLG